MQPNSDKVYQTSHLQRCGGRVPFWVVFGKKEGSSCSFWFWFTTEKASEYGKARGLHLTVAKALTDAKAIGGLSDADREAPQAESRQASTYMG